MLKQSYKDVLFKDEEIFCKNIDCSICGGSYDFNTFICKYCDTYNQELEKSFTSLSSKVATLEEADLDLEMGLHLYHLAMSDKEHFGRLLDKFSLADKVKEGLDNLKNITEYSDKDIELLNYIFSNDTFMEFDKNLRDELLRRVILKENNLSKNLIFKAVSHLVLSDIRTVSKDGKFLLTKTDDNIKGLSFYYNVYLAEEVMNAFYDKGSVMIFYVLAHEMRHTYQNYCKYNNIVNNYYDIMSLKEQLLRAYKPEIYDSKENYLKSLGEIDANVWSYYVTTNYLESLGFKVSKDMASHYSGVIYNDVEKFDDSLRKIDGELVDINTLFASYIKDKKELFQSYPQLHYEFKKDNGSIVYKSKMELVSEFLTESDGKEELYLSLIKEADSREKKESLKK